MFCVSVQKRIWNTLPPLFVTASHSAAFRRHLKTRFQSNFITPPSERPSHKCTAILRQCDNYNLKYNRQCNNMSRINLSGYAGHVTIFS